MVDHEVKLTKGGVTAVLVLTKSTLIVTGADLIKPVNFI